MHKSVKVALTLAGIIVTLTLLASCKVPITGMQAPLGRDYDPIQWRPLEHVVMQATILAPGYSSALQNDADVTPGELKERIAELPDDVRSAEPKEIRIRLRPNDESDTYLPGPTIRIVPGIDSRDGGPPRSDPLAAPLVEVNAGEAKFKGDWLIIDVPESLDAGVTLIVQISPDPNSSAEWEYGVTPDRKPYGGWFARLGQEGEIAPDMALSYATIFTQDPDAWSLAGDWLGRAGDKLGDDLAFTSLYAVLIGSVVGAGAVIYRDGKGS